MFEQYVADLNHVDPAVRYQAAQKLGASSDARAIQPLIAALPDANAKVQYAAFSGLIKLNANEAVVPMLDVLLADPNSKLWGLLKLNIGLRLRKGLLDLIPSGDAHVAEYIYPHLHRSEFDFDHVQKGFFVRIFGRTGVDPQDGDAAAWLTHTLLNDTLEMRAAAAEALGYLGDDRAIAPLLLTLKDEHNELREIAAEALGRLGDPVAFNALVERLSDDNEWVRRAAVVALADIGDRRAIEPITDRLQDETTLVQDAAFDALKQLSYGKYDLEM